MAWLPPSLFVPTQNYEFRPSADEHLNGRVTPSTDFCPYDVVGTSRRQRRPSRSLRARGAQRVPRCPRRSASSRRRACFVGRVPRSAPSGRESRRSAACSSRATSDSGVSAYIVSASLAGPRRSATSVTTSVRRTVLIVTSIVSPVLMTFEGFTRSPFTCTRPPRTALVAALRVLNMRAAQSHLSIRT
jgi:hypothetical protein